MYFHTIKGHYNFNKIIVKSKTMKEIITSFMHRGQSEIITLKGD